MSLLFLMLSCAGRPPATPPEPSVQVRTFEQVWRLVGDSYPYEDMKGLDWQAVHDELLPAAELAQTADALRPTLNDMLGRLGESHYGILPGSRLTLMDFIEEVADGGAPASSGGQGDVGLELRLVDGELVVFRVLPGTSAAEAGVRPGWVVESIDGRAPLEQLDGPIPLNGRAETFLPHLAKGWLMGSSGSEVAVGLRDGEDAPVELSLARAIPEGEAVELGALPRVWFRYETDSPRPDVGVMRFNIFMTNLTAHAEQSVLDFREADVQGVIIDLRGNPGGVAGLSSGLAGFFIDARGKSLGTMLTREAELAFNVFPRAESQRYDGPVALLVDELSMSTSELFAAGMQELGEARVFGATTGGMALPSRVELLPNGDAIQYAFADLFDPAGDRIEGVGVTPDVAAPLDRASLLAGADPALDAAICWILSDDDGACP